MLLMLFSFPKFLNDTLYENGGKYLLVYSARLLERTL